MSISDRAPSRRPRIILDARLIAYRAGGISRYTRELARWLPQVAPDLDIRVAVIRRIPEIDPERQIRVFTPPHHRWERWTLGVEFAARRPDLVHSTDFVPPRIGRYRRVATVHDLAFLKYPDLLTADSLHYYRQTIHALETVHSTIAVSAAVASDIASLTRVESASIHVVHNGVDHRRYHPTGDDAGVTTEMRPALAAAIDSGRKIVLVVGTIEPRKRVDIAIDAARALMRTRQSDPPAPLLVVVGMDGWRSAETVEMLTALERDGGALWLRDVSDTELATIYRGADLYLMPSIDEGFGLGALEAMASGVPVVCADIPALREVLGAAGRFVAGSDPQEWAASIERVLDDVPARSEYVRLGIERARRYDWRETAIRTADVYREALRT